MTFRSKTTTSIQKNLIKALLIMGISMTSVLAQADEEGLLVEYKSLTLEAALKVATETMKSCRESGYQVGVAVVDRSGVVQVVLRDRFAGPHTADTSTRKAWTAVNFKGDTVTLANSTKYDSSANGIRFVHNVLMAGGGVPILAAGSLIGGVGVSGAPSGQADHVCAEVGIESIMDELEF